MIRPKWPQFAEYVKPFQRQEVYNGSLQQQEQPGANEGMCLHQVNLQHHRRGVLAIP